MATNRNYKLQNNANTRVFVDVDDLIRFFEWSVTPTGIGRVEFEIIQNLFEILPGRIVLCSIGASSSDIHLIPRTEFGELLEGLDRFFALKRRSSALALLFRIKRLLRSRSRRAIRTCRRWLGLNREFRDAVSPGDILLNLGASWETPNYGTTVRDLKQDLGLKFAVLVHDILPVTHLNYVSRDHVASFQNWLFDMSKSWDVVVTPSKYSATRLEKFLVENNYKLPFITPIRYGDGFKASQAPSVGQVNFERPFVLFVSTIEVRKNHQLLVNIWRKMIKIHGEDAVPTLVFVGKMGWEIEGLRNDLTQSRFLDGKIVVKSGLSDSQVSLLYQDCLFTVFPSHCEGWGLPVTESLAFGKYCIASNATSIPEAGGAFCDYFEPDDEDTAYELIQKAIFDFDHLDAKSTHIKDNYVPSMWSNAANQVLEAIGVK